MQAIEAQAIEKVYRGGTPALRGIDLEVGWGEIFGYLGRNGSGKTTTVRVLTTLTRPSAGSAWVAGHDVRSDTTRVREAIGVTMQEAALDDHMTAREHLDLMARLWGLSPRHARRRAGELLERFALADVGNRIVGRYSGGMRRRLDIATALIREPRVLFLDEPTTGLVLLR